MDLQLSWAAEYAAFACMLGISILIGLYYGFVERKQSTVNDYLLGGKHMSVFPITMSLIASHISGITLLGVPSEIYVYGTQYLIVAIINIFIILIVIYVFLPVFYDLQLTSVYEYFELRFNRKIRGLASLMFTISLILYIPVVIYIPALAFNQVSKLNVHSITPILCLICIFYTTVGGLKAVVWTDAVQSLFTTISIVAVIILGIIQVGGVGNVIKANAEGNRLEWFNMDPDPLLRNSFWTVSIGTTFSWVHGLGMHPGAVQRFVALPTYNKARKALIYFILGIGIVKILTGAIGMLVYTKFKDCDPVMAGYIENDKNLLPLFVTNVASNYPGLTGLFISGIVSTALSTMSAQLNTVSGTIYEDFIVKLLGVKVSDLMASIIMKATVVIVGIICVSLVLVVEKLGSILQGALWGMIVSFAVMSWITLGAEMAIMNDKIKFVTKEVSVTGCPSNITLQNTTDFTGLYRLNHDVYVAPDVWKIFTLSYMHYSTVGTLIGISVGLIVSLIFPKEQHIEPNLLTPFVRRIVYPNHKNQIMKPNGVIVEEYNLVPQNTQL
ncbi:sodium-coupled monocarboxylate transporter 2-like isoform X2 [Daktulosphaira vitifoliae]|uniref:sodium-coupled monocarboxylate transporter 2-like isoform X2 n=1 Tax=Daktulosphaira vitifoliae TaxID=58002 RepID=UPI0021AAC30F|nr:sodium-coupled monocarboxylate transporter 2-like isoform X2 [Daktulosphaira vitifoliae]